VFKVNILFDIIDEPWGGGNQFLRTLKRYLISRNAYADRAEDADVLLVNSKNNLKEARYYKKHFGKKCVHRIDGIFSIYRGEHERHNDLSVYDFAKNYADAVIFQSEWSRAKSKENGMSNHILEKVIYNCADDKYFYDNPRVNRSKINLVTTSWSGNAKKGFGIYEYLDTNLDFGKYNYNIICRKNPSMFKNIKAIGPLDSMKIGIMLRTSDIFITATEDDTCSNSLIEALTCGVVGVGLQSGGTPEIIGGGELFNGVDDVIEKIDLVANNIQTYRDNISVGSANEICGSYYDFMESVI